MTETITTATARVVEQLTLGYVLERAGDVKRDSFGQVVGQVATDTGCEVWHGTP